MEQVKHKLIVMSGKGGVGKSTVASNLAVALGKEREVGIVDVDITGPDVPKILGIEEVKLYATEDGIEPAVAYNGVKVISMAYFSGSKDRAVIWRGPLKMKAINQMLGDVRWGELDYMLVDLPPGTSDEPLSIAQNIPDADGAIVVTTPQDVALLDVRKAISFAKTLNMAIIGIIENMSGFTCPECGHHVDIFKKGGGEAAARDLGLNFLGRVPLDADVVVGGDDGKPFVITQPDSETTKAFMEIVERVVEIVEGGD
ncbi:MAG: Mrp/NBP35 family ATP-binding protein [Thermoplasmata archaeon]